MLDAQVQRLNNLAMSDIAGHEDKLAAFLDREEIKLMYEPVALIASVVGGLLASKLFARIWRAATGERDVPQVTDETQSWAAILPAAALHGIVFGVIKALVDRIGAKQFERMTGIWPWPSKPSHAAADSQTSAGQPPERAP
jgi:hypothetical protein